jgi:hypothetical protein
MKILSFFLFFGVIFALLDPDPDPAAQINADPSGSETLLCSAQAGRQVILKSKGGTSWVLETSFQPLKGRQITRTKAYRQSVLLNCATNILSQLMFAFS